MLVAAALGAVAAVAVVAIGERGGQRGVTGTVAPGYNERQARIAIGTGDAELDFKAETSPDYRIGVR